MTRSIHLGSLYLLGSLLLVAAVPAPFWSASVVAQEPAITEFLALGGDTADEDGDFPDWIEIHNPGAAVINLGWWYLTDDAFELRKWRFPDVNLAPGDFLLVFASGKDRADPGRELHTNFQLTSAGEYLALVMADGITVVHEFFPEYPQQHEDISYGTTQEVTGALLVTEGAPASLLVPAGDVPGGGGHEGWLLPGFDDSSWTTGAIGVGHDSGADGVPPDGAVNLAPQGTATQSSDVDGGQFPASLALDGDFENFTHTAAGENLPATWELDLGEARAIATVVLYNRADCCQSRLRDITVSILDAPGGGVRFESDLLNPENALGGGSTGGPATLTVDLVELAGGSVSGRVIRLVRTPDPDLSGTGGEGNDDEADVLSLSEVEVLEGSGGYRTLIQTDVRGMMQGVNSSLYLRIPFAAEDADSLEFLKLRMKYDDGFVAYLNGTEVARRNAPDSPRWDSQATAARPDREAIVFEEINISEQLELLRPGLNLLAIHGLNVTADDDDFLILPELIGISFLEEELAYFRQPTPGAPNDTSSIIGFVEDTKFSRDRGFYDAPFEVEISTATEGAEIRYTLDGNPPTASSGAVYGGPIPVERTTTLRAAAFKPGLEPTNVDTHTYVFLDDVVRQDHQATLGAGFPRAWGSTSPDYGMDPDVIGPNDRFGGVYAETIRDDLKSLPTLSIVMNIDDMFGSRGIYTHSTQSGVAWERPTSVELIYPDGRPGFQVDCGIRIQGGWFRSHSGTKKHSLRLLFKRDYGPTKLRFPWFGADAVGRFDTITLRAGANDGYSWDAARLTEQYTRDEFGRSLQLATGNAGAHGTFVHLYINGIYWGLYNPVERPDHSFSASYYGGEKESWDSVHDGVPTNGSLLRWNEMIRQAAAARSSPAEYQKLQGRNPDGARNADYAHLLDVPNYVDYLIVNLWGGNWDWPWKNWWAGRDQSAASTGFKFYCWDYENTMGNNRNRSPLSKNALQNNFSSAGQLHQYLSRNPEYQLLFADRVHRFFFHGGILTPESLTPRYAETAAVVERAIVAESARWGDQHFHPPLTLREWYNERDWLLGTYLPRRSDIVLQQFRAARLYPAVEAPIFNRHGGPIDPGFSLIMSAPAGAIYYTLDGTDPRRPGGEVAPAALTGGEIETTVLLPAGAQVRALVPEDDSLGLDWIDPDFDDASWIAGQTGVGFERSSGYEDLIETDLGDVMYDINSSVYLRLPFDLDPGLFAGGRTTLAMLILNMKYDDGYVAYLNGARIAALRAPESPVWNSRSAGSHSDTLAVEFESVHLTEAVSLLRPGRNLLAIHGLNSSASGNDFLIVPQLEGVDASEGIVLEESTIVRARALDADAWSALNEATFVVDNHLRITEIMYHPAPPPEGSPFVETEFEFVELQNVGDATVDLTGVRLEKGIKFDFVESEVTALAPGEIVVLVRNRDAFASRYDTAGILVAGEYRGRLDNLGDAILLRGPVDEAILDFAYDDAWHPETDGQGPSLVIVDSRQDVSSWAEASSWRPSEFRLGSPGLDESGGEELGGWQRAGDLNQDTHVDLSDAVALLGHLFQGAWQVLPCGDGTIADEGNRLLLDANGDETVSISDAVYLLNYLFLGGTPPPLGADCVRIPDCPDACE